MCLACRKSSEKWISVEPASLLGLLDILWGKRPKIDPANWQRKPGAVAGLESIRFHLLVGTLSSVQVSSHNDGQLGF